MADNDKEIQSLEKVIQNVEKLKTTIDHLNSTKSIQRFGKEIRDSLKDADSTIAKTITWAKALKAERDQLYSTLEKQPLALAEPLQDFSKVLGGLPAQMASIAKKSTNPISTGFRQMFGNLQYLFTQQLKWYATKAITLNILQIPQQAIQSAKEFNQGLIDIASVSRAAQVEIDSLGRTIVQVALSTKYSVSQIAEAGKLLAQAGFNVSEINASLAPIAQMATATGSSLKDSADLVITAIRSFKADIADTSKISDIFINAVTNSKVTIEGLGTSFNYLASTSANLGINLTDTVSLIGTLANSGQRLSTASTGLRTALLALTAPTKKMKGIFAKYGITIDQVNPRLVSMTDILNTLSKLSKEDLISAFSIRSANAILALQNAGSDAINTLKSAVAQTGTASAIAKEQLLGLQNAWDNLKQTILSTEAQLGNRISNSAVDLVRGVQSQIAAFNKSLQGNVEKQFSFGNLVGELTALGLLIPGVVKSFKLLKKPGQFKEFLEGAWNIQKLKKAFSSLGGSVTSFLRLLTNPAVLAITGVIATISVAVGVLVKKYIDAKQALGNYLNDIDRQTVAIGKTIGAINKLTFSYQSYINKVKEAYKNNEQLRDSLVQFETEKFKSDKLQELDSQLNSLKNIKLGRAGSLLEDIFGIQDVKNMDDFIAHIFKTINKMEEFPSRLINIRTSILNALSNTDITESSILKDVQGKGFKTGNEVAEEYAEKIKGLAALIRENKITKEAAFTEIKGLSALVDKDKEAILNLIELLYVTQELTNKESINISEGINKLSASFTDIQSEATKTQEALKRVFYISQPELKAYYDNIIQMYKKLGELNSELTKYQGLTNLTVDQKKKVGELTDQRTELQNTLETLEAGLGKANTASENLINSFSSINVGGIKLSSVEIGLLGQRLKELEPSLDILKKTFKKESFTNLESLLPKIDKEIFKKKAEIAKLQSEQGNYKNDDEGLKNLDKKIKGTTEDLKGLRQAKQYIIGTTNEEINTNNKLIESYKQLHNISSENIKALLNPQKAADNSSFTKFVNTWKSFASSQDTASSSLKAFLKTLGISKETFTDLNKEYGTAASTVLTFSKVIADAKKSSTGAFDNYNTTLDQIDQAIKALENSSEKGKNIKTLLDYLKDYKASIEIDFDEKKLKELTEGLKNLYLYGSSGNFNELSEKLKELANKGEKQLREKLKKDGLSDTDIDKIINNKRLKEQVELSKSLFKEYIDSLSDQKEKIRKQAELQRQEVEKWYKESQINIAAKYYNPKDKQKKEEELAQLKETKTAKLNNIESEERLALINADKEMYQQRLTLLEGYHSSVEEKVNARINLLNQEREAAIQAAKGDKDLIDLIERSYDEKISQEQLKTKTGLDAIISGYTLGVQQVLSQSKSLGENVASLVGTLSDSMTQSISSFLDATSDKFLDWKNMVISVMNDVYRELMQKFIVNKLVESIIGAIPTPSKASTPSSGSVADFRKADYASIHHTGGRVGYDSSPTRKVPLSLFSNAPRLHTGGYIKSNEVPTILKKGEYVLTPEQMKAVSSNSPKVNVQVIDQRKSGAEVETESSTGKNGEVNIRMLIKDEVRSALASGGYDKTMKDSFGLKRTPILR